MISMGKDKPKQLGRGPKFITCYICGKQFGKSSLPIHEKACIKKFNDREMKKPKKERRPLPKKSQALAYPTDNMSVDEYNALAQQGWEQNLIQCEFCQRTFREEAYKHHQKACSPSNAMKRVGAAANKNGLNLGLAARSMQRGGGGFVGEEFHTEEQQGSGNERVECPHCSRKFAPQSIQRHVQVCGKKFFYFFKATCFPRYSSSPFDRIPFARPLTYSSFSLFFLF